MGRRREGARVLGPYPDDSRGRWRVVQVAEDGTRTPHYAETEAEARLLVKACLIDLGIPTENVVTVTAAIAMFVQQKRDSHAWSERTFERTPADLRFFAAAAPEAPISLVNAAWVRTYIERLNAHVPALASRKTRYDAVAEFLKWCERRKFVRENPCKFIDPSEKPWTGKRAKRLMGRGKPQLRNLDEAQAYLAACLRLSSTTRVVAAALPLLTGLRSGAVRHLRVADIDFGANRIWTRDVDEDEAPGVQWDTKTASSRMTVGLPAVLSERLASLCQGRAPQEFLFLSKRHKSGNPGPYDRKWLNRLVQEVCVAAGTRVVCAHGLRDSFATVQAALAAKTAAEVAVLLGHDDDGQTAKRHYIGVPEHRPALDLPAVGSSVPTPEG
jgi:integrase